MSGRTEFVFQIGFSLKKIPKKAAVTMGSDSALIDLVSLEPRSLYVALLSADYGNNSTDDTSGNNSSLWYAAAEMKI